MLEFQRVDLLRGIRVLYQLALRSANPWPDVKTQQAPLPPAWYNDEPTPQPPPGSSSVLDLVRATHHNSRQAKVTYTAGVVAAPARGIIRLPLTQSELA